MKCPNCSTNISLLFLFNRSLPHIGNRSNKEEVFCPSCKNRIYWGFRPVVIFLIIILAEFVLFKFGKYIIKSSIFSLSLYIILSTFLIILFGFRLYSKAGKLNSMNKSFRSRINVMASFFLIPLIAFQIAVFYFNFIPSRNSLIEINDTIVFIKKLKNGFPDFFILKNEGPQKYYYIYSDDDFAKEWQNKDKLLKNMKVTILAEKSKNIFKTEDSYQIWEISAQSRILLPYEMIRKYRKANASSEIWGSLKIIIVLVIFYLVSLDFKQIKNMIYKNAENV